jgi:hypothetical protein
MNKGPQRFGITAMSKGFITVEQFAEAMKIQAGEDLAEKDHRLIGEILLDLGHMTQPQIREVIEALLEESYMFECPECGVLIFNCPNCGTKLRPPQLS